MVFTPRRILIVEDDPGSQIILKRMIQKISGDSFIRCVPTAEIAHSVLNDAVYDEKPYDLVVADLSLPGSNGLVLWEVAMKHFPTLDFLFVSGTSYEEWCRKISTLPTWPPFIHKPVSEDLLKRFWDEKYSGLSTFGG